jgi:GNAT superfamily N-acetyltransferase
VEGHRPAADGDVERVAELAAGAARELLGERGGPVWAVVEGRLGFTPAAIAAEIARPDVQAFVGTLDEVVVGYAIVGEQPLRDGSRLAVLTDVYVEPEARGLGLGEMLLEDAIAWAEARGCRGIDAMALPGMRESKNLFERFGLKARRIVVHRAFGPWADGAAPGGPP